MANGVYKITEDFEKSICDYTGAPYAVTLDNQSNGLFLSLYYEKNITKSIKQKKIKIMVAYITELNSENYTSFTQNEFSLVDVWAPWCGPCKLIAPIIDEVSSEYLGKLVVGKLNADDNMELVKELGVRNIPTLLFYKNGVLLTDDEGNTLKLVGNVDREKLKTFINKHLS